MVPVLADATLSSAVADIVGVLTSLWTFISGNWLLVAMAASPLVIWLISALMGAFRGR